VKILSVVHGPAFGGAHNQALRLAPGLERRGISTVVALPDEAERAAERLRGAGVKTVTLPLGRLRASPNPHFRDGSSPGCPRTFGAWAA
jgi:hypothetical protein